MELEDQNRKNDQAHITEMVVKEFDKLYVAEDRAVHAFEKLAEEGRRSWTGHLISGLFRDVVRELTVLQRDQRHLEGLFAGIMLIYSKKIASMLEVQQSLERDGITGFMTANQ